MYLGRAGARAVVPCVLASFAAFFTAGLYGLAPHTYALGALPAFDWLLLAKCLGMGALFGLAGLLFSFARRFFGRFFAVSVQNAFLRVFAGGVLLSCLLYLTGGRYAGLGTDIVDAAISGEKIYAADFALKILFTAATLGAGVDRLISRLTALGRMSEALAAVVEYLFTCTPVHSIAAWYEWANPASGAVLKKQGFVYEKEIFDKRKVDSPPQDTVPCAYCRLTKACWAARTGRAASQREE